MRNILILLFVIMLTAQSAFAAAARYCEHEGNASATGHFGHHVHEHGPDGTSERSNPDAPHPDCAVCQLAFAQSLTSFAIEPARQAVQASPADCPLRINTAFLDGLLRPPQALAA